MTNSQRLNPRRALLHGLYVITDERAAGTISPDNHIAIALAAIKGGAQIIQLRAKNTPLPQIISIGHTLRAMTSASGVLLLVNDRPDVALAIAADGVHLGPDDFPLKEARGVLGPDKIIGVSCANDFEARKAFDGGANYIGAGAVFSTSSKADAGAPIGLEKLREIVKATPLPVAAIGGIGFENIASVRAAGAQMACVISAVTNAPDEDAMMDVTLALGAVWDKPDWLPRVAKN